MRILYYDHGNGAVERNHRPDPRCRRRPPVEFIAATLLPHFPSRNSVIVKYCDENAAFFVPAWINKFESCEWTDVEKHVLFPFSFFFTTRWWKSSDSDSVEKFQNINYNYDSKMDFSEKKFLLIDWYIDRTRIYRN